MYNTCNTCIFQTEPPLPLLLSYIRSSHLVVISVPSNEPSLPSSTKYPSSSSRKLSTSFLTSFYPFAFQAQLIHDRNTASHAAINDKAETGPERVHMTWTKDKLLTERNRNRECNANVAVRDLFNMRP